MKKAEIHQVFIYLMVIIVVGTLILVGSRAIIDLLGKGCDVQISDFKLELKKAIEGMSNYGSSKQTSLKVPCSYEKLCFLNATGVNTLTNIPIPQIQDEARLGTGRQLFLVKGESVLDLNYVIDGLEVENKFFCVDAKASRFNLKITGVSRGRVMVTDPLSVS